MNKAEVIDNTLGLSIETRGRFVIERCQHCLDVEVTEFGSAAEAKTYARGVCDGAQITWKWAANLDHLAEQRNAALGVGDPNDGDGGLRW